MEPNSILNAFVVSARQYASSPIEHNLLNLRRHLDIVAALTGSAEKADVFDPQHLVVTECFACFINIILDNTDKPALIQRVITIFKNLVDDPNLVEKLQTTFHLHSALSLFLQNYGVPSDDPLVLECYNLLEVVTQDVTITYVESHLENLINSLIVEIDNVSSEVYNSALHILSNLCRRNLSVRSYICNLPHAKVVYKSLVSKLCCPVYTSILYAVSVLASLTYNNSKGAKIFTQTHVIEAFELIVQLLVTKDETSSKAALELFLDFVDMNSIFSTYVRYEKLEKAMTKVVNSCSPDTPSYQVTRCLKFLWAFTNSSESMLVVYRVLCPLLENNDAEDVVSRKFHPILMQMSSEISKPTCEAALYTFKLVKSIIEACPDGNCEAVKPSLMTLVKNVLDVTNGDFDFSSSFLKMQIETYTAFFDLLFVMCQRELLHTYIAKHIQIKVFQEIVSSQLEKNSLTYQTGHWNEYGVDLVLATFAVIIVLKDLLPGGKAFLDQYQKEPRLMPFLAYALSSSNNSCVNRSLYIITTVNTEFPLSVLVQSIATSNFYRRENSSSDSLDDVEKPLLPDAPLIERSRRHVRRDSVEKNVDSLIQRLHSGLNLKDLRSFEILDIYEHKIASLSGRVDELQNLLNAKSVALQQADKLLSQYKCRQAQRDAEALKLRKLLKDSEKRSEMSKELAQQAGQKYCHLEAEHEKLRKENSTLSAKIQELKDNVFDLNERLKEEEADRENEKKNFQKTLKEKDIKVKELCKNIREFEESLKVKDEKFQVLEATKEALKSSYDQKEKDIAKLEQDLKLLELMCQQGETANNEKDAKIKILTEELDKLKYITGMIHEISSGKVNHRETFSREK